MNQLNVAILSGSLQATAFMLVALGVYFAARRLSPKVGAMSALATLLILVAIAPMSVASWPRWDFANFQQRDVEEAKQSAAIVSNADSFTGATATTSSQTLASTTDAGLTESTSTTSDNQRIFWLTCSDN